MSKKAEKVKLYTQVLKDSGRAEDVYDLVEEVVQSIRTDHGGEPSRFVDPESFKGQKRKYWLAKYWHRSLRRIMILDRELDSGDMDDVREALDDVRKGVNKFEHSARRRSSMYRKAFKDLRDSRGRGANKPLSQALFDLEAIFDKVEF